jgi:urease accessory protein
MLHAVRVIPAGNSKIHPIDSVILDGHQRRAQRGDLTGVNGTRFTLNLPEPVVLRMGDTLELDDGKLIEIVVAPEPLVEIRGDDLTHLARLAWHLGDRHVPVQIMTNRLRMRRDDALEALLGALGARLVAIEAPFDPEGGAYATRSTPAHDHHNHAHHHDHPDHHGYDHAHDHHGHDHGHHHHKHD